MGLTFKENVPDTRNSQSILIAKKLSKLNYYTFIFDPLVNLKVKNCKSINSFTELDKFQNFFDGILILVSHKKIISKGYNYFNNLAKKKGIFFDIKNIFNKNTNFKL